MSGRTTNASGRTPWLEKAANSAASEPPHVPRILQLPPGVWSELPARCIGHGCPPAAGIGQGVTASFLWQDDDSLRADSLRAAAQQPQATNAGNETPWKRSHATAKSRSRRRSDLMASLIIARHGCGRNRPPLRCVQQPAKGPLPRVVASQLSYSALRASLGSTCAALRAGT